MKTIIFGVIALACTFTTLLTNDRDVKTIAALGGVIFGLVIAVWAWLDRARSSWRPYGVAPEGDGGKHSWKIYNETPAGDVLLGQVDDVTFDEAEEHARQLVVRECFRTGQMMVFNMYLKRVDP